MSFRILIAIFLFFLFVLFALFYVIPAFRGEIDIVSEFHLGRIRISLYGMVLVVAILASFFVASRLAPKVDMVKEYIEGLLPWVVVFGFLGARLYFVAFSWDYFGENLLEILQVWHGGLAIYGGILGGVFGAFIYGRRNEFNFLRMLDLLALSLPLGQALGRWGNFFNQEAFGRPTSLPWGLYVSPLHRPYQYLFSQFFHPTFLYESLWDFAVFFLLLYIFTKRPRTGFIAGSYLIFYGMGRFFIESLRLDSFFINSLRIDQVTSLLAVLIGALIIICNYGKHPVENN